MLFRNRSCASSRTRPSFRGFSMFPRTWSCAAVVATGLLLAGCGGQSQPAAAAPNPSAITTSTAVPTVAATSASATDTAVAAASASATVSSVAAASTEPPTASAATEVTTKTGGAVKGGGTLSPDCLAVQSALQGETSAMRQTAISGGDGSAPNLQGLADLVSKTPDTLHVDFGILSAAVKASAGKSGDIVSRIMSAPQISTAVMDIHAWVLKTCVS